MLCHRNQPIYCRADDRAATKAAAGEGSASAKPSGLSLGRAAMVVIVRVPTIDGLCLGATSTVMHPTVARIFRAILLRAAMVVVVRVPALH